MMYAPYLSNLYYANYKDFSRGFQISSNFSIKLHLCNIFTGLNPRWKYPRHGTMLCFLFTSLSISRFSCITQQKSTEMYWFSCSYLKYLLRQHRHYCRGSQWLPGLYCAITAAQTKCMLTHHGPSVKRRCQLEMPSIHSEDRKYLLPQVSRQELTDQSATSALREIVAFASQICFVSAIQSELGEEEAMQVLNRTTPCKTGTVHHFKQEGSCLISTFFPIKPSLLLGKHQHAKRRKTKKMQ